MYAIMNKSAIGMTSFDDFQCDFCFDFAWQQDHGSFVLCSNSVCSSPHTGNQTAFIAVLR